MKQAAVELEVPTILMKGTGNTNIAGPNHSGESCGFTQNGWGHATRNMNFDCRPEMAEKVVAVVTVDDDRHYNTAEAWSKEIQLQLQKARAPIQFEVVQILVADRGDHRRALEDYVKHEGLRPSGLVAIIFLANGSKQAYADAKRYCLREGIVSQAVNLSNQHKAIQKGVARNPVIANLTKQIINKPGHLVWWAELQQSCPSFAGGIVMQLGVDMSMAPSSLDGESSSLCLCLWLWCCYCGGSSGGVAAANRTMCWLGCAGSRTHHAVKNFAFVAVFLEPATGRVATYSKVRHITTQFPRTAFYVLRFLSE